MPLKNTTQYYGWLSILLHWVMAICIIGMFTLGLWMSSLEYYDPWYREGPYIHKSIGILLLCLLIFRLFWRLRNIEPAPEPNLLEWEKQAAYWTHRAFYLLLFCLMISGYFISTADGRSIEVFNWLQIPAIITTIDNQEDIAGEVHEFLAWTIITLVVVHASAAIKHHFIDKNNTLRRMIGISKP